MKTCNHGYSILKHNEDKTISLTLCGDCLVDYACDRIIHDGNKGYTLDDREHLRSLVLDIFDRKYRK